MKKEYTVITGDQHKVYDLIENYFDGIQREIDLRFGNLLKQNDNLLQHPHFERRVSGLRPPEFLHEPLRPDDHIHMLLYKDKVIAVVTEVRDRNNMVQFSFFDNLEDIID